MSSVGQFGSRCTREECGRPCEGFLCPGCVEDLVRHLSALGWLVPELEVVRTRQTRTAREWVGSRSRVVPLPWNESASYALAAIQNTVSAWCAALQHGPVFAAPGGTLAGVRWLMERVPHLIAHRAEVGRLADEVSRDVVCAWRVVDLPDDGVFLGRCATPLPDGSECACEVMATPTATAVVCWGCSTVHDVAARRVVLLARLQDHIAGATRVASMITVLGLPITASTVRNYGARGMRTFGPDSRGRPLYRFGDVLAHRLGPELWRAWLCAA
jgi:hypothetical protein